MLTRGYKSFFIINGLITPRYFYTKLYGPTNFQGDKSLNVLVKNIKMKTFSSRVSVQLITNHWWFMSMVINATSNFLLFSKF